MNQMRRVNLVAAILLALSCAGRPARALPPDPWMADEQVAAAAFHQHPGPKQVVVVFDISGSMQSHVPETGLSRWQEARAATSELLRTSLNPGDWLAILPFDSVVHSPEVFPNLNAGGIAAIGERIPDAMSGETGTNMRMADDRALQMLHQVYRGAPGKPAPWQAIVIVSDGFNDAPPIHSAAWYDYAKYCNVHADNQNLYPDTPQCIAWRADARRFAATGEGQTFGIGVKIEEGVPEYRPPGENPGAPSAASDQSGESISGTVYDGDKPAPDTTVRALDANGGEVDATTTDANGAFTLKGLNAGTYTLAASKGGNAVETPGIQTGNTGVSLHMTHNLIWLWVLLAVLALIAVAASAAMARTRRQSKVRIQIKDPNGRNRTYWLGGGTRIGIGGKESPGVFPMEAFDGPVAYLRHAASGYSLLTEKGIEAESGGRKIAGAGQVSENSVILLKDGSGSSGTFEFRDISTRTRTAAAQITGQPGAGVAGGEDAYAKLDASLKG